LRDSLLGAGRLADLVDGRADSGDLLERRRAVLDDELRYLALAASRARRHLIATAVLAEDQRPSGFFDLIAAAAPDDAANRPANGTETQPLTAADRLTTPGAPLDLRGLVATLRRALIDQHGDHPAEVPASAADAHSTGPTASAAENSATEGTASASRVGAADAARVLAALAAAGVQGAHPAEWTGLAAPTTTAPLYGPEETVVLSPSKVETLATCPLRWALEGNGGHGPSGTPQALGTLIHELAETYPVLPPGGEAELLAALEEKWPDLGLPDNWQTRHTHQEAQDMVRAMACYLGAHPAPLAVEAQVDATVTPDPAGVPDGHEVAGPVRLVGRVDRVELASSDKGPAGGVRIVDWKTAKQPLSAADAATNPQLGSYQLAVAGGTLTAQDGTVLGENLPVTEAALLYVRKPSKQRNGEPTCRSQAGLANGAEAAAGGQDAGGGDWMGPILAQARAAAAANGFTATANKLCDFCQVATSCPVSDRGRQVTL
jgi:hypothetical protein